MTNMTPQNKSHGNPKTVVFQIPNIFKFYLWDMFSRSNLFLFCGFSNSFQVFTTAGLDNNNKSPTWFQRFTWGQAREVAEKTMFRKLPHLVHRELPISHFSFRITPFTWHKGQRPWGWSPPKSQRYLGPKPPPALQCRPSNGNFISPQSGLMVADNPWKSFKHHRFFGIDDFERGDLMIVADFSCVLRNTSAKAAS